MLLKQSAFFEAERTFGLSALEVFVLVSVKDAVMSFEPPRVVEAFGAVWKFAFKLFDALVLEHVTPQVRVSFVRTSTSRRPALVQTLSGVHGLVLVQPPLTRERGPTVRGRAVKQL